MNEKSWKVKMVRRLTDKVSPDVIVESSFEYDLPREYGNMLDSWDDLDDEYKPSVVEDINQYLTDEFAASGFFPLELICPE